MSEWERILRVNAGGPLMMAKAALHVPVPARRGGHQVPGDDPAVRDGLVDDQRVVADELAQYGRDGHRIHRSRGGGECLRLGCDPRGIALGVRRAPPSRRRISRLAS